MKGMVFARDVTPRALEFSAPSSLFALSFAKPIRRGYSHFPITYTFRYFNNQRHAKRSTSFSKLFF